MRGRMISEPGQTLIWTSAKNFNLNTLLPTVTSAPNSPSKVDPAMRNPVNGPGNEIEPYHLHGGMRDLL
jgi:hypothetical protein